MEFEKKIIQLMCFFWLLNDALIVVALSICRKHDSRVLGEYAFGQSVCRSFLF